MTEITQEEMRERLGNIGQIRDLLFGSQMRDYEKRFQSLESQISELLSFKQEIQEKLDKTHDSLNKEIVAVGDSLEKRLKYLSLTTHEEFNKINQDRSELKQKTSVNLADLSKVVNSQFKNIKEELNQTQTKVDTDIDNLKKNIFEALEKQISSLKEVKVSRDDLAEVLFELCIKVKGTDFVPDLKEAMDSQTDFLLPEQQANQES